MLELVGVTKKVGQETHIAHVSLSLHPGSLNVLLGPTLSGKTSLMRLMAGLDRPTSGDIRIDGRSVLGVPVQKRSVAMVYQQFINYPTLTVYENIASPLRIAGKDRATIDREVTKAAELLRLTPYLGRLPLSLSGGQQQRTALARAIVKNADLVLLDEPLANLDYKLREELRDELPKIFAESGAIFVYATTEASEALLLGGKTATLHQGRVTQFGPTVEVYRDPADLVTATTFSDPPMNTARAVKAGRRFKIEGGAEFDGPAETAAIQDGPCVIGFRAHHLGLTAKGNSSAGLPGRVKVTEITGSESFVHLSHAGNDWVMLTHGIHGFDAGTEITVHLDTSKLFVFAPDGSRLTVAAAQAAGQG
jgi:glycerol transport system ATP-binding protein